ncbi:MAG: NADH-quinone oxidoreductase subunit J [Candidatus Viridilinea halotolerans]|uniref:NADH-quinone oxidoreductase subunit J n=1 Tax=Candidatus Viridilinea halotolerans TaxID=2491704 RepID=A0A426TQF9_9CHLR|nr:MAG: NADH-quinone oxidoreductase subunit J [Candidatus Viridilinea halotolerans]
MNTLIQVIFAVMAALIVGAAMMAVTVRDIIHAALWLIASFFGVGALYLLLEAEFVAVVQVLVYVGAISILILFAVMLTRHLEHARHLVAGWRLAITIVICVALFAAVLVPTLLNHNWNMPMPVVTTEDGTVPPDEYLASTADIGRDFVFVYLLHFQIAGVLLTMALIGAIVIAFEERSRRGRVLTLAEEHILAEQRSRGTEEQAS